MIGLDIQFGGVFCEFPHVKQITNDWIQRHWNSAAVKDALEVMPRELLIPFDPNAFQTTTKQDEFRKKTADGPMALYGTINPQGTNR